VSQGSQIPSSLTFLEHSTHRHCFFATFELVRFVVVI
jgi:hypothetical protein